MPNDFNREEDFQKSATLKTQITRKSSVGMLSTGDGGSPKKRRPTPLAILDPPIATKTESLLERIEKAESKAGSLQPRTKRQNVEYVAQQQQFAESLHKLKREHSLSDGEDVPASAAPYIEDVQRYIDEIQSSLCPPTSKSQPDMVLEPKKVVQMKLDECTARYFYIPVRGKLGPIYMRLIKDVNDERDLPLRPNEDCKLLMSKFVSFPTPVDHQYSYSCNQLIRIEASTTAAFETKNLFFGLYSMSGIRIRIGFGWRKDYFGSNKGLFKPPGRWNFAQNKAALQKEKEDQRNAQIEKEIFEPGDDTAQNAVKFRK